jgi:hypothetical protein
MAIEKPHLDKALAEVDPKKRATLKRLIGTGVFVKPVVASFPMAGLSLGAFLRTASAASGPY